MTEPVLDTGQQFQRVAILGLGLLGGSVALAARRAGVAKTIVAAGRRQAPLQRAMAEGVVDEISDIPGAVSGADLVVLGMPVGHMEQVLSVAAPHIAPGALVTDVGSVKGGLADTLPGVLAAGVHYVGSHPMAGSHKKGVVNARADLFEGACCVVTTRPETDASATERIAAFWRALGARVTLRDPEAHDREVAWMSHLPHAVAFAYAQALAQAPASAGEVIGSGFRDFTRIAHADVELWTEILDANRKPLAGPLQAVGRSLQELGRAIEEGDTDALEQFLTSAHQALAQVSREAHANGEERGR